MIGISLLYYIFCCLSRQAYIMALYTVLWHLRLCACFLDARSENFKMHSKATVRDLDTFSFLSSMFIM